MMKNPFLTPYTTPHGTVPFDQITLPDYEPAIREGMRREDEEIEAIINNPEEPTFDNTIVPKPAMNWTLLPKSSCPNSRNIATTSG